jgi:hypothetical protein
MINIVIFLGVAGIAVFLFFTSLRYLGKKTVLKNKQLYSEISSRLNFTFYDTDTMGLADKIKSMFDFGKSSEPIKNIVCGEFDGNKVYIFERDDEPIRMGTKGFMTPIWAVFLLELNNNLPADFLLFHKNTNFWKMKDYKYISPDSNWKEMPLNNFPIKDYKILTTDNDYIKLKFGGKLNGIVEECINKFKRIFPVPRWITIQKKGNYFAIYADGSYFNNVDELEAGFDYTKRISNEIKL